MFVMGPLRLGVQSAQDSTWVVSNSAPRPKKENVTKVIQTLNGFGQGHVRCWPRFVYGFSREK